MTAKFSCACRLSCNCYISAVAIVFILGKPPGLFACFSSYQGRFVEQDTPVKGLEPMTHIYPRECLTIFAYIFPNTLMFHLPVAWMSGIYERLILLCRLAGYLYITVPSPSTFRCPSPGLL